MELSREFPQPVRLVIKTPHSMLESSGQIVSLVIPFRHGLRQNSICRIRSLAWEKAAMASIMAGRPVSSVIQLPFGNTLATRVIVVVSKAGGTEEMTK